MAHFAKIGKGNKVLEVLVVSNDVAITEQAGADYLNKLFKTNDIWKQTSYNTRGGVHRLGGTPFRKNYAGIGFTYDEARDAFVAPQLPYSTLNEDTCRWENNIPYPEIDADTPANQSRYAWDNLTLSWVKRTLPNL